jgi:hypothetical protein
MLWAEFLLAKATCLIIALLNILRWAFAYSESHRMARGFG